MSRVDNRVLLYSGRDKQRPCALPNRGIGSRRCSQRGSSSALNSSDHAVVGIRPSSRLEKKVKMAPLVFWLYHMKSRFLYVPNCAVMLHTVTSRLQAVRPRYLSLFLGGLF